MNLRAEIHEAPADAIADGVGKALGVRPGSSVNREQDVWPQFHERGPGIVLRQDLLQLIARDIGPFSDDEHAIVIRRRILRVDYERSRELRVFNVTEPERGPAGGGPIVVGPRRAAAEPELADPSCGHFERRTRGFPAVAEAVHDE